MSNTTPSKCAECENCIVIGNSWLPQSRVKYGCAQSQAREIDDLSKRPDWCPLQEKQGE